jgi:hypothetical protein
MQSLYAVMLILALFSFLYILHQEQELDILPVYAVQQEQEQGQTDESKAEQAATFNTTSSLFYPITGILLDTSPISNSLKNPGGHK